jgi:hypothetical protein
MVIKIRKPKNLGFRGLEERGPEDTGIDPRLDGLDEVKRP